MTKSWWRRDSKNQCRSRLRRETMWCQERGEFVARSNVRLCGPCWNLELVECGIVCASICGQLGVCSHGSGSVLRSISHARHSTSSTALARVSLTREYRDLLSCVTFLLLYCQLRVTSGESNSLFQFSVLSVLCTLHEFALSCCCGVCCSSKTLAQFDHISAGHES